MERQDGARIALPARLGDRLERPRQAHRDVSAQNAALPYDVLERAVPIHPTVSELIPTMLGEMRPAE